MTAGVPQGSLLSPLLFNIFASDMPKTGQVMLAQYADDTALLYRSTSPRVITGRLQEAADALDGWFRTWRISVNAEKSTALLLTRRRLVPHNHVNMAGRPIPWEDTAKYLGLTLDRRLRWTSHIRDKVVKAKTTLYRLWPLLNRNSAMSTTNKLRLYKSIIRPQMLYASPAWGYTSPTNIHLLQVRQNRALRFLLDAPWYVRNSQIHRDMGLQPIEEVIREASEKFFAGLKNHPLAAIREIEDYDEDAPCKHKRPKHVLIRN